jgi:hypothetical protein
MPTATPPGPPARITTGNAAPITNEPVAQHAEAALARWLVAERDVPSEAAAGGLVG